MVKVPDPKRAQPINKVKLPKAYSTDAIANLMRLEERQNLQMSFSGNWMNKPLANITKMKDQLATTTVSSDLKLA